MGGSGDNHGGSASPEGRAEGRTLETADVGNRDERAEEYCALPNTAQHDPSRFMLLVAQVRPEKRETIPAVTHVDGTGRLQTVFAQTNPRYHRLIDQFGQATGVPVLMNTSFNLRGEPIITTPQNAYSTFARSEMDLLVMGDYLIEKQEGRS